MGFLRIFLILLIGASSLSAVEDGWHLSTFMGGSMSMDNRLYIHLKDQPDQEIHAQYTNQPFTDSHWWAFRTERFRGDRLRGFELIHHKIYLRNTNDVVTRFSISDGYNLAYYNMGKAVGRNRYRFGMGMVLGHPDVTIEGRDNFHTPGPTGHFLAGPSVQFNYERVLWENMTHFVSVDTKLTLSYARVMISDDHDEYADAPDVAFHVSVGFGSKPSAFRQQGVRKLSYFTPILYPYLVGTYVLGTGVTP